MLSLLVLLSVGVFLLSSSLDSSSFFSTITFLSAVALLPALSETVYLITYSPSFLVSTLPVIFIFLVISPSTLSVATAPGSLYVSPTFIVIVLSPKSSITGFSVSFWVWVSSVFFLALSGFVPYPSVVYAFLQVIYALYVILLLTLLLVVSSFLVSSLDDSVLVWLDSVVSVASVSLLFSDTFDVLSSRSKVSSFNASAITYPLQSEDLLFITNFCFKISVIFISLHSYSYNLIFSFNK